MLPQSHVAYTWLALSLAQEHLDVAPDTDYRVVALAAMGSDLIDKPLATVYFYRRYKSAVLFAHTLIAYALVTLVTLWRAPRGWPVRSPATPRCPPSSATPACSTASSTPPRCPPSPAAASDATC